MDPASPDTPLTPEQALELAVRLHQGGRLQEAEQIYRELLRKNPRHLEALHLLGLLMYLRGRLEEGHDFMRRALEVNPRFAEACLNLGNGYRLQGRTREAIEAYRQALGINPDLANAHNNLGLAYKELGQTAEAEACYRRALEIDPRMPETACNLGNLLRKSKRLEEAEACYRQALAVNPRFLDAYNSLGNVLRDQDRLEEAEACLQKMVSARPDYALGHYNLALVLRDLDRIDEAIAHYRRAVSLQPEFAQAHNNLANLLKEEGRLEEAIEHYRQAVQLDPGNASAAYLLQVLEGRPPEQAPPEYVQSLFEYYSRRFEDHLLQDLEYATPRLLRQVLDRSAPPPRRFVNVLDLGCGTGLAGLEIRHRADHLTGVDLAPAMIEEARRKNLYDVLRVSDLQSYLERSADHFDLVLAADVLVYFGNLRPLFFALAPRLTAGGLFAFSTETGAEKDWQVQVSGRYTHAPGYLHTLAGETGFRILHESQQTIRRNKREPVAGGIYLFEKI